MNSKTAKMMWKIAQVPAHLAPDQGRPSHGLGPVPLGIGGLGAYGLAHFGRNAVRAFQNKPPVRPFNTIRNIYDRVNKWRNNRNGGGDDGNPPTSLEPMRKGVEPLRDPNIGGENIYNRFSALEWPSVSDASDAAPSTRPAGITPQMASRAYGAVDRAAERYAAPVIGSLAAIGAAGMGANALGSSAATAPASASIAGGTARDAYRMLPSRFQSRGPGGA
jgi:hypothetical protein